MPAGKTHILINLILGIPTLSVSSYYAPTNESAIWFAIGFIGGSTVMSPDLDLDAGSINQANARRIGGNFFGGIYEKFWWGYGKYFKHRGISHYPIFGTLTRLIYMMIPIALFRYIFGVTWLTISYENLLWLFLGLEMSSLFHIVADKVM